MSPADETHMRLSGIGDEPARALCSPEYSGPLVTDPADVTCRPCGYRFNEIMAEAEEFERERAWEDEA